MFTAEAQIREGYNMRGIYKEMISKKQKDFVTKLQKEILQFDSIQEMKSDQTTIVTDMDS